MNTALVIRQMLDLVVCDAVARGLVSATASTHTLRHTFAHNYPAEHTEDVVGLETLSRHTSLDTTRIIANPPLSSSLVVLSSCVKMRTQNYKVDLVIGQRYSVVATF